MVQGYVRTREYRRIASSTASLNCADSIGKLDRAERKQESDAEPDGYDS